MKQRQRKYDTVLSLTVASAFADRLRDRAERESRSVASILRVAVRDYLDQADGTKEAT